MHSESMLLMRRFKELYSSRIVGKMVLDVGAQDINGCYRLLFSDCEYYGLDIVAALNVDYVCLEEDKFPLGDDSFDVVISGQCLEHCRRPWRTVREISRVLKPGGIFCLIAPWRFHLHKDTNNPMDCWRILEDGMKVILDDAGLKVMQMFTFGDDTCVYGEK